MSRRDQGQARGKPGSPARCRGSCSSLLAPPEQIHASPRCPGKGALGGEWYRPLMAAGQSWQSWGESRERLPAKNTGMKAFMSPACAVSSLHLWLWGGRGSSSACWCALVEPPGSLSPPPVPTPHVRMPLKSQCPHLLSLSASAVCHLIFSSTFVCFYQVEPHYYLCCCYHHRHYLRSISYHWT